MLQRLKEIYEQDQQERENWEEWGKSIPLEEVKDRDAARLKATLAIIANKDLVEGIDYYHAAMILQHSLEVEHYKLANELCSKAIALGESKAKWLYAATLDRYLLSRGDKFQKYGTQYKQNSKGFWKLCPIEDATTDEMRAEFNVPSLKKLKAREDNLNKSR
ncbi:MAG: hypothetical protein R3B92_01890 [Patescibacteria group bacterium]|uniref:Uncharacterized protein n=1 Tax=candidate division WWE3 bacterium TaxID=2053526 RepID=A0A955ECB1_UNCKA|nr:hypothetical protein [candidate division WWE3 bacterium]